MKIERYQGDTDGVKFGYVFVGDGGCFFEWCQNRHLPRREQVRQVVASLTTDTEEPPTGRWSWAGVERALRSHIAQKGLR